MTPLILVETLAKKLREVFSGENAATEFSGLQPVQVFEHDLPRGDFGKINLYPHVIVTCKGTDEDGVNSLATIALTIGTFSDNIGQDWRDMFHIAEKVRQFILTTPILEKKFHLEMPMAFETLTAENKESDPFVFGIIAVRYRIATPRDNVVSKLFYGDEI